MEPVCEDGQIEVKPSVLNETQVNTSVIPTLDQCRGNVTGIGPALTRLYGQVSREEQ